MTRSFDPIYRNTVSSSDDHRERPRNLLKRPASSSGMTRFVHLLFATLLKKYYFISELCKPAMYTQCTSHLARVQA